MKSSRAPTKKEASSSRVPNLSIKCYDSFASLMDSEKKKEVHVLIILSLH